jgi:branched-chain amino acid transport system permease protein
MIMGLFASSLNLLLAYTGMVCFGGAAFFGVGAYTGALLVLKTSVPFPLAFMAAPVVAAFCGLIIGWFCVRLSDIFFAMLTLAFGELIFAIIFKWYSFTGGDNGLVNIPLPSLLEPIQTYYYFVLVIVIVCLTVFWILSNSPFGKTLQAIRDNAERVEFIGVNVRRYKLIVFVIFSFFAGISGVLFAFFNHNVFPVYAGWVKGAEPLLMIILGGTYNFLGPTAGAAIFLILEKVIFARTEYWPICMGVVLACCVLFLRGGLLGFLQSKLRKGSQ